MRKAPAVLLVLGLTISACTSFTNQDSVLVMAAASLTDAFAEIETAFEAANPMIEVDINVAGSSSLREQILQGAPAGVFASADESTMDAVAEAGAAVTARTFATNQLVIAVPIDNPGLVSAVSDLANPDLLVGLCAAGVPCGDFARQSLEQAGVTPSVDTNEGNVRALLTKIETAELDAGVVYATDAAVSEGVVAIALPSDVSVDIEYPIAVLTDAPDLDGAQAFVNFVLSAEGQAILAAHGFGAP